MSINFEKAQFMLSTATAVQSNLAVSGAHPTATTTLYRGTNLISTWNVSLRSLIRNIYDKYTRIYLEIYLITTAYIGSNVGFNNTWDQNHILKLEGLTFVNNPANFIYVAPFKTAQGFPTAFTILDDDGFLIDTSNDDFVTLSSTLLQPDFTPHCAVNPWPTYNIFFNAYGVPGYERVSKDLNKNNY